ncbi:hypothetical protein ACFLTT_00465 [Chloroflexota bacterium]
MKKFLIVTLLVTILITSVSYANTFTTASGTIVISDPSEDIASSNVTATQPDWDSICNTVTESEYLRPNLTGDEIGITYEYPSEGLHYTKVNEEYSDDDASYIFSNNTNWEEDLYQVRDSDVNTGSINYVEVYIVAKVTDNATQTSAYVHMKTNGNEYNGSEENVTNDYTTFSTQWTTNPQTASAWTWSEINSLQIGVALRKGGAAIDTRCTQVYVEVNYDAIPITGTMPLGDLFEVTKNTDYSEYLTVKIYLTNTDNLTKAYQYLNLELFLENSAEAGETPNYQLFTLENGVATFNLEDGASDNQTLSLTGGSYWLNSHDCNDWDSGWTVTPEFYCEITQR